MSSLYILYFKTNLNAVDKFKTKFKSEHTKKLISRLSWFTMVSISSLKVQFNILASKQDLHIFVNRKIITHVVITTDCCWRSKCSLHLLLMITAVGCSISAQSSPVSSKVVSGPGGIAIGTVIVIITTAITSGCPISAFLGIKSMPCFFLLWFWTFFPKPFALQGHSWCPQCLCCNPHFFFCPS